MVKKILMAGAAAFGAALFIYVNNEIRKEYDECVDENDRMRDFIQKHDFYEKSASKTEQPSFKKESCGSENCTVYTDERSGFKVYEYGKRKA